MKRMKKLSALITAVLLGTTSMTSLAVTDSLAVTFSASTTASEQEHTAFTKKWSKDIALDVNVGGDETAEVTLTIGFDTWVQDEDYVNDCWAPTGWEHFARVKNSSGTIADTKVLKGGFNTGKADVKHTGPSVTYYGFINV